MHSAAPNGRWYTRKPQIPQIYRAPGRRAARKIKVKPGFRRKTGRSLGAAENNDPVLHRMQPALERIRFYQLPVGQWRKGDDVKVVIDPPPALAGRGLIIGREGVNPVELQATIDLLRRR